jgi:hypothetical protein
MFSLRLLCSPILNRKSIQETFFIKIHLPDSVLFLGIISAALLTDRSGKPANEAPHRIGSLFA